MIRLEDKLRSALRREPAPEGFAERVLARTRKVSPVKSVGWRSLAALVWRPAFRWAWVAAAACLVVAAGVLRHQRQERLRQEGELARVQVRQALRLASAKLNEARSRVLEINRTTPASRL